MNENPDGTPSPLNPDPETPVLGADMPSPETVVSPQESVAQAQEPVEPNPAPKQESVAPIQEPVAPNQGPTVSEPAKKSHKAPAIIITIILLLTVIGCGVAAIVLLKPFGGTDAVPAAISKLMGGAPDYVTATGTITATSDESVSKLSVAFKASMDNKNRQSYADANVTADLGMDGDFEFSAEEIHTSEGNLYLKLSGIVDALEVFETKEDETLECIDDSLDGTDCMPTSSTNCIDDPTGLTNCGTPTTYPVMEALGLLEVIDDEWIQIPDSAFSSMSGIATFNPTAQCLISAADKLDQYGNDFANLYNENQFINYSTDGITIAKKQDPIYKLSFDANKLAGFINAMGNSGFMNELNACMGYTATNVKVDASSLSGILAEIPALYVEINDNNDFTRVYLSAEGEGAEVTIDISFSYPSSITIEEPEYYIDFNSLLSQVLGGFFNIDISDQEWINCQPPLSDAEAAICEEAEEADYPYITY